jgi:hypothetical protein
MAARPWLPIVAVVAYGALIVLGQRYFASRPAWNVRRFMAAWNALLSVFSFVGFVRVVPAFVHLWKTYSWMENFCIDPESHYASGSTGLWLQLFSLSKLPYVGSCGVVYACAECVCLYPYLTDLLSFTSLAIASRLQPIVNSSTRSLSSFTRRTLSSYTGITTCRYYFTAGIPMSTRYPSESFSLA